MMLRLEVARHRFAKELLDVGGESDRGAGGGAEDRCAGQVGPQQKGFLLLGPAGVARLEKIARRGHGR